MRGGRAPRRELRLRLALMHTQSWGASTHSFPGRTVGEQRIHLHALPVSPPARIASVTSSGHSSRQNSDAAGHGHTNQAAPGGQGGVGATTCRGTRRQKLGRGPFLAVTHAPVSAQLSESYKTGPGKVSFARGRGEKGPLWGARNRRRRRLSQQRPAFHRPAHSEPINYIKLFCGHDRGRGGESS